MTRGNMTPKKDGGPIKTVSLKSKWNYYGGNMIDWEAEVHEAQTNGRANDCCLKYIDLADQILRNKQEEIEFLKNRGECLAQAIRDLYAHKNYPEDFENLRQALSVWEGTQ